MVDREKVVFIPLSKSVPILLPKTADSSIFSTKSFVLRLDNFQKLKDETSFLLLVPPARGLLYCLSRQLLDQMKGMESTPV
jgi:hypothetical protein